MTAKLTLGPVLFNWPASQWRDFYLRMADEAPVDTVVLGETVCSKRAPFYTDYLPEVIERLQAAGKEVVLSTLALIMSPREMDQVREIAAMDDFLVEANDVSAAALLAGRPHTVGPFVNVYNEGTLSFMSRRGARRVCLPVELAASAIAALADGAEAELEVMTFGRLPLAISARCYHARSHNLAKDNCQYVCDKDPDGLDLETVDGEDFLAVNGVQTMSYTYANLIGELPRLREMGVNRFRLSPHTCDMVRVAQLFRGALDGTVELEQADEELAELVGEVPFSNGYFYGVTGVSWEDPAEHDAE